MPLKNKVNTVTKLNINKLGMKNSSDGIIYSKNKMKVTKAHSGKKISIGIMVIKFQNHQRGQVNRVMGQIKAFRISPMGIQIMKLNGQKFHIMSTSWEWPGLL
jgi:hypothetical protein